IRVNSKPTQRIHALPVCISLSTEPHVRPMHQCCWLHGMVPPLMAQVANCKTMKFMVNDRNEFAGGFLIAVCELFQQRGYVGREGLHSVPPPISASSDPGQW